MLAARAAGSWVVRNLVHEEVPVVGPTAVQRFQHLKPTLTVAEFDGITFVTRDIRGCDFTLLAVSSARRRRPQLHRGAAKIALG